MSGFNSKRDAAADRDALFEKFEVEQPAQDPVVWTLLLVGEHHGVIGKAGEQFLGHPKHYERVDVYTAPPKRKWVGLEKSDMPDGENPMFDHEYFIAGMVFASNVLKDKNA